jgi:hypothetical protein
MQYASKELQLYLRKVEYPHLGLVIQAPKVILKG